jgi:hypothetical protein
MELQTCYIHNITVLLTVTFDDDAMSAMSGAPQLPVYNIFSNTIFDWNNCNTGANGLVRSCLCRFSRVSSVLLLLDCSSDRHDTGLIVFEYT